ncbi:hypothetical protein RYZ26_14895 [Terasakiella sp. A23]|uniref:hypothetical protein n=1 Tax=Terasakiella sp. FCG-A23 TaxID=3080561 RepID=UPI0029543B0D|nr:hypothetical protein [Terasakiella sp. A23]MDV7340892.1 hypothetical protein [Terasakiella sp. A23]
MRTSRIILSLLILPFLLSSCITTSEFETDLSELEDRKFDDCWNDHLTETKVKEKLAATENNSEQTIVRKGIQEFFNCYLGPEVMPTDETAQKELLLLRHHAVLSMLSEYAAYKFDGQVKAMQIIRNPEYKDRGEDAQEVLGALQETERAIRAGSSLAPPLFASDRTEFSSWTADTAHRPHFQNAIQYFEYLDRIIQTMDVVRRANKPAIARLWRSILNIKDLVNNVTSANLSSSLGSIKSLALNAKVLKSVYPSNRLDLFNYLNCVSTREETGQKPANGTCKSNFTEDWKTWDNNFRRSCDRLAVVIEKDVKLKLDTTKLCVPPRS